MPRLVTLDRIRAAAASLKGRLHRTPVVGSSHISERTGVRLVLKLELLQKTGSFKPRGVLTALDDLSTAQRDSGVVTLSAGNHAQAVAWAAGLAGIASTIVMPSGASQSKVDATRAYGGDVVLVDGDLLAATLELQQSRDLTLIHPFDDLRIIAGHGSVGLEILEDVPDVDVVLVACGGGGLLAGVAAAMKAGRPGTRVIGVEPAGAAGMRQSLESGNPVRLDRIETIADGLAAPFIGVHTYAHARALVDELIVVEDREIVDAMRTLMQRCKIVAEPAGAAALAPLLSGRLSFAPGTVVVVVLSGGNVDLQRLKQLL